ncbi:RagB/SusD domain-containing protein [Flavobacterium sp. 90]|uniref:RagB/SusD family nutrient uptake outer membrane protein n=1 Tax=unclassified Flavobacterium TaxID=196869 RepID=UPI000EB0BB7F|nr:MULTISPECIES: RagB/SusD family nutrient uptake outer membrane protein [unclassified Flavobacterium]RKR05149.1 SusD-like starch-binding protein associating with outer membrane [Flavobacterium sp. 81]TCK56464.1 RagB/SusD domain-containing protein [Flavobacterium sp. 90]
MKTILIKPIFSRCSHLFKVIAVVLLTSSCDSFVEVDLPKSQLTNASVFDNYSTASAALTDIYSKLRDQGLLTGTPSGLSNQLGNYADELTCYSSPGDPALLFYTNTLLASNTTITDYWNISYNQIYAANAIIEGSVNSTKLNDKEKQNLKGESLFIRALVHFYLTNLYGEIPYITTTDYKINNSVKKIEKEKIYQFITTDLKEAAVLLDQNYTNPQRIRPNKFTAQALLSRVYLYMNSYPEASNAASAVLNATNFYTLENDPALVFLKDSKETIWQLQPSVAGKNTDEAGSFIFFAGPPPLVALTDNFMKSFTTDDLRKDKWTASVTDGVTTWCHPYKYKEFDYTAVSMEYSIVFRLAEQYLIRAEARIYQGDFIGAKEDLNKIRNRAGLANTTALTKEEILTAILEERRWELFTEYGHRFFDLKRSGKIDAVLSASKSGWNTTDVLFPLPENELSVNPNLRPQNSGY